MLDFKMVRLETLNPGFRVWGLGCRGEVHTSGFRNSFHSAQTGGMPAMEAGTVGNVPPSQSYYITIVLNPKGPRTSTTGL